MTLAIWLVLGACTVAVATDIAARRIPNLLTGALAIAALAIHFTQGWGSFGIAILQLVAVMLVGFLAFSMKWLGGGDVKLLAAAAAALEPGDVALLLLYTAIGGGILAIMFAIATGRLTQVVTSVGLILRPFAYKGTTPVAPRSPLMLPYACAIAFGAVAVALSHTAAPFLRLHL